MKKIILAIITLIICSTFFVVYAFSTCDKNNQIENKKEVSMDFELLPTMNTQSSEKNQVWIGTFQLVWNDLIDEVVKHPFEFTHEKSTIAENLNKKSFGVNDLSESAYYKKYGLVSPKIKAEIEDGIRAKFNENSNILDSMDWTPDEKKYILYAMLKKDFEFIEHFEKLDKNIFYGSNKDVEYFGLTSYASYETRETVNVLFYNNDKDFALKLKSKQGDIVYLYRTDDDKTLDAYYSDMQKKEKRYNGNNFFEDVDEFKVPILDFQLEKNFDDLCNKQIKNTDLIIGKAIESIQFKMDEAGVKLKSEAAIECFETGLPFEEFVIEPRYFYFNDKFVMFISEEGKKPYFAMKVTDAAGVNNK